MKIKVSFFIVVYCGLLFSCSKSVLLSRNKGSSTVEIKDFDFSFFTAKARLKIKDDNKIREVKTHIRIRKDSIIWMTFNFVGLQGGRLLINKDSLTFVSNIERKYYSYSFAKLSKLYNSAINFQIIQSLILGNGIGNEQKIEKILKDSNIGIVIQKNSLLNIKNYVNLKSNKIEKIEFRENNTDNFIDMSYQDFQFVDNQLFPFSNVFNISYRADNGVFDSSITLNYIKAEISDKALKFPFNIPRRYELH